MFVAVAANSETAPGAPVAASSSEKFDFAAGGTIRIQHSFGDLTVEGWDQASVQVDVVKSMGYGVPASEAAHDLDSVKVTAQKGSATEMTIATTRTRLHSKFADAFGKGREATVEYRIRVPRDSHLIIGHEGGDVNVIGVAGSIEAANTIGDITVIARELAKFSLEAHTRIGLVSSDVSGSTHNRRRVGEDFTGGTSGGPKLTLSVNKGGVTLKDLVVGTPTK